MPLFGSLGMMITSAPALATFIAATVDGTDATTYTFASQTLKASMIIAVDLQGSATQGVSSVTVGGVTATAIVSALDPSSEIVCALYRVSGVTPGTGSIVVVGSVAANRCGIGTWETTGRAATASATGNANFGAGGANPSISINIPANGFGIGVAGQNGDAATWTWTGLTERYDGAVEGAVATHTGASSNFTSAQTGLTVTAARTPAVFGTGVMVVAAFGPA